MIEYEKVLFFFALVTYSTENKYHVPIKILLLTI